MRTNSAARFFWSDWQSRALGCLFCEQYGQTMLSRLLMSSKEVGNAQSMQQTFDIFLTLPPSHTAGAEKQCRCFDSEVRQQVHQKCPPVHSECITCLVPSSCFSRGQRCRQKGLTKPLACIFQECCPVLRLRSNIFSNCLGRASSVLWQRHECQMVRRILLTPMHKSDLI